MPISTRTRNTSETRKNREVRSAKMRRVRVAALTVDPGRTPCGLGVGEEPEAFGALAGRRMEVKVGSAMKQSEAMFLPQKGEGRDGELGEEWRWRISRHEIILLDRKALSNYSSTNMDRN